jgi:hypothetical protein
MQGSLEHLPLAAEIGEQKLRRYLWRRSHEPFIEPLEKMRVLLTALQAAKKNLLGTDGLNISFHLERSCVRILWIRYIPLFRLECRRTAASDERAENQ